MILIVEGGATKTEWALRDGDDVQRLRTPGINVAVMPAKTVAMVVSDAVEQMGEKAAGVEKIRFYGAGLVGGDKIVMLDKIFKAAFPAAEIAYGSDLLAAAQAAFGRNSGIVAILGTGSNSALYDGHQIVRNVCSGGFVLGDEGGGDSLGRIFLSDYIKSLVPAPLAHEFERLLNIFPEEAGPAMIIDPAARHARCYEEIVRKLYSGDSPSGYLASFVPFILENRDYGYVQDIIRSNFMSFVTRSLRQYDLARYSVAVVGSFGCACREELLSIGEEYGINFSKFVAAPIEELIKQ